jgi:Ni/Co efflux regulator RcnB
MKRVLAVLAALTISMPAVAHAQGLIGALRDRQEAQKNAPAQPEAGPRQGGRANEGGRANAQQAAPAQPAPAAQADQRRGRGGPNAAQGARQPPALQPNVAQEPDRRGGRANAQLAPRQGGPAGNFAENRDRGRDDNSRGRDDNSRGRDDNRGRDFRNDDRGRDFRGDRDRGGRSFNFRGRQYAAIRGPAYSYPRGWGYRHWGRGEFLPSVFLSAPFYFDYDLLSLPPPPPGARWVRNGPDALLVSGYDGRILDVIYNAFY